MSKKDKSSKRISINDLVNSHGGESTKDKVELKPLDIETMYTEEYNGNLIKYNEEVVTEIDELYASLIPTREVVVRIFVKPLYVEDGIVYPSKLPVRAPTKNGPVGTYIGELNNPFPYATKAVVVSLPGGVKDFKAGDATINVGDVVSLSENQVQAVPFQTGDDAVIIIKNSFIHPEEVHKYPEGIPTDPMDKNYGYLKVDPYQINFKLPK